MFLQLLLMITQLSTTQFKLLLGYSIQNTSPFPKMVTCLSLVVTIVYIYITAVEDKRLLLVITKSVQGYSDRISISLPDNFRELSPIT